MHRDILLVLTPPFNELPTYDKVNELSLLHLINDRDDKWHYYGERQETNDAIGKHLAL